MEVKSADAICFRELFGDLRARNLQMPSLIFGEDHSILAVKLDVETAAGQGCGLQSELSLKCIPYTRISEECHHR